VLIDAYEPDANFVSARQVEVAVPAERLWDVLPELPAVLRNSRWAAVAAVPLWVASVVRGERGLGHNAFTFDRIDQGREVVLVGHHRFADFATNFYVEPIGADRSRLHNVTRARFKTVVIGRLYLAGVRVFHDPYVDWWLRSLKRLAERDRTAAA
jgi:hypothetical protein